MEKQLPQPGWRYRHFKGGLYQIVTLALNTETGEDMVVYQALYDDFKVYVHQRTFVSLRELNFGR